MAEQNFPDRALYNLDNLDVLRGMNSETVDLIATDPPFNKKRNRSASAGQYEDAWRWADHPSMRAQRPDQWKWQPVHRIWLDQIRDENEALIQVIEATRLTQDDDTAAFLCFLGVRLLEMRRVLKPSGSIYLHCDHSANGYIRMVMDAIFGKANFRNEIVWQRMSGTKSTAKRFFTQHDTLFYYVKTADATWHRELRPLTDKEIEESWFKYTDSNGRRYKVNDLTAPSRQGGYVYEFLGAVRRWRYPIDRMKRLLADGHIHHQSCTPGAGNNVAVRKRYLDEFEGRPFGDIWTDIKRLNRNHRETTGSPDQKPIALYERIIRASSNPGDIVLDPFCGCATTPIAAHNLGRRWVGIDRREDAAYHIANRLLNLGINVNEFKTQQQLLLADLQVHCEIRTTPPPFVPTKRAARLTYRPSICVASRPPWSGRRCSAFWWSNGGYAVGAAGLSRRQWSTLTLTTCCRRRKAGATSWTTGLRYAAPATAGSPTR